MTLFVKEDFKPRARPDAPAFDGAYDVLVAGLGSGGFYAAWRAAKLGLKTLGIERMDAFGGQTTLGCVCGTLENRTRRLADYEAQARDAGFDVLRETTVIGAWMEGRRIAGLRVLSNGEVRDVRGRIVIDATGDASVARMAGCRVTVGRATDHAQGATSKAYIYRLPDGRTRMGYGFYRDSAECACAALSAKILGYAARDLKTHAARPVVAKATILGAREQGHVACVDSYTLRDALCERPVADPIFISRKTPFDLVRIDGDWAWENDDTIAWKEICGLSNFAFRAAVPYGTMVPADCEGLLLAGKHFGVAHDAGGGLRMQSHMRHLGLAAAAAAKVALARGCALRDVPYDALRPLLTDKGAFVSSPHAVNIYYNAYKLEAFDAAAVVRALERPYEPSGDWVAFRPRGAGEEMAWAYCTCWRTALAGTAPARRALADTLAARLAGPWAHHFAIALGLLEDPRAVPALLDYARRGTVFRDRLKCVALLRLRRPPEARAFFRELLADDARAATARERDEQGISFARATVAWKRFQFLSYAVNALEAAGEDLTAWRRRPLELKCGARDGADLAPLLKAPFASA